MASDWTPSSPLLLLVVHRAGCPRSRASFAPDTHRPCRARLPAPCRPRRTVTLRHRGPTLQHPPPSNRGLRGTLSRPLRVASPKRGNRDRPRRLAAAAAAAVGLRLVGRRRRLRPAKRSHARPHAPLEITLQDPVSAPRDPRVASLDVQRSRLVSTLFLRRRRGPGSRFCFAHSYSGRTQR